jgi:predicted transcriptional regulator
MTRRKFASQADPKILDDLKAIADAEGRQFQAVIEEAFADYIQRKKGGKPRPDVMAHLKASMARNAELYRKLAK